MCGCVVVPISEAASLRPAKALLGAAKTASRCRSGRPISRGWARRRGAEPGPGIWSVSERMPRSRAPGRSPDGKSPSGCCSGGLVCGSWRRPDSWAFTGCRKSGPDRERRPFKYPSYLARVSENKPSRLFVLLHIHAPHTPIRVIKSAPEGPTRSTFVNIRRQLWRVSSESLQPLATPPA